MLAGTTCHVLQNLISKPKRQRQMSLSATWSRKEIYLADYLVVLWSYRTIEKRKPSKTLNLCHIPGVCFKEIHCARALMRVKLLGSFKLGPEHLPKDAKHPVHKWQISRWWLEHRFYHHITWLFGNWDGWRLQGIFEIADRWPQPTISSYFANNRASVWNYIKMHHNVWNDHSAPISSQNKDKNNVWSEQGIPTFNWTKDWHVWRNMVHLWSMQCCGICCLNRLGVNTMTQFSIHK